MNPWNSTLVTREAKNHLRYIILVGSGITKFKENIAHLTHNRTLGEFLGFSQSTRTRKICIVMDEVDGMSAGDRGGMAELIQLIKNTQVNFAEISSA